MPERKKYTDEELNALKPSQLLRLAVEDAKLCEQDDRYYLDMDYWHEAKDGLCRVCMAGAVMAKTQGVDPGFRMTSPYQWVPIQDWMKKVDDLRQGYGHLLTYEEKELISRDWGDEFEERAPWDTYLKVADMMEARGS